MARVPLGNEKSSCGKCARVGPDADPDMALYSISAPGIPGEISQTKDLRQAKRYLPEDVYTAIDDLRKSEAGLDDPAGRGCESPLRRPEKQAPAGTVSAVPTESSPRFRSPEFDHDVQDQFL